MAATLTLIRDTHTDPNGNVSHRWAFELDGSIVSELLVEPDTHVIDWVWTHEDHREQGHATRLYQLATAKMTIFHAPESHRTPEGGRFAARVGGPAVECTTCCVDL